MKHVLLLALFFILLSCNSSVHTDILPPKKMQAVLWDMMQADEMAEYYSAGDSSFRGIDKHVVFYQNIFAIHKVTKASFKESLNYYRDHPASLKTIFDSLQHFGQRLLNTDTLNKKHFGPMTGDTATRKLHVRIHPM